MESISRPYQSRKVSNATTKQPYDGVFSKKLTAGDYREIFGSSQAAVASSIPVLDLSTLGERSTNMMMLNSNPDYSNIFASPHHNHVDVAVCYQDLFASDKFRPPSSSTTTSHDSDNLSPQSSDGLKQFNMSYNKISPKSKDELDGTKHVTQLHAIPGFTRFIDQRVSPPKMKSEKLKSSPVHVGIDSSKENESVSEVTKIKTFDIDAKIRPSKVSSPSASPINVVNHKSYRKRSTTMNSKSCKTEAIPTSFDEELDVNSAASALKKAIEKAQESIRIAKESVGRKKKGLGNFSNRNFKDSSKVKNRTEDVSGATSSNVFPDFVDGEKLSVAKKVIDEMNGKIMESNKFKDNNTIVSNSTRVTGETESKSLDSAGKYQYASSASEAVYTEKTITERMEVVHEDQTTTNAVVDDYEGKIEVTKTTTGALEHQSDMEEVESVERVEVDIESEENTDAVRLSKAQESVEKSNNLIVDEKVEDEKHVSQESDQYDNETRLKSLENKTQEEVLEQEDAENAENAESHKGIEEVSNWSESENEFEGDHDTEIHEEETNEMFKDVSELETKASAQTFDNRIEESKESAQAYDYSLEESETTLHVNCEMKQEDNHTGEKPGELLDDTFVQEFEKMSSCDENVMEETDTVDHIHESCQVDMNDKNMETTQEVRDVTEAMERADASEVDEVCETDYEDEYELKSEENEVQSESSSGTIDGVKIEDIIDNLADLGSENDVQSKSSLSSAKTVEEEESNTQLPQKEIPDTIKDSQESQYGDKEDDIEEPGPSKVWGKEHFRRIDEETSRERENEKNRLAVNRAIREARERAFIEARERAERERAAVEKATEEVRQRMMADVREKVAKASAATKSSSERTSAQSKLRAERAAVERATSEARQRALEKAMSQKSASDLNSSESALRSKANLEKHNRIMERAAQALAEKEKRDLLAQKEQAERNRLAENLDADIKRWSKGKEGNLRALLSTLQYILEPESGWQAVSLTEIMTSNAVKKAYRKATLCVHPDKLQQRGATIQQKYICEKVFDLLKAACNRFNSDEK